MSTPSAQVAGFEPAIPSQRTPVAQTVVRPPVDIFEDADGITLQADIPGVSREHLNVHVDGTTLILEGDVSSFGQSAAADDASVARYRRTFTLSRELQTDLIEAKVKDGVLTVRIPKRAEDRPRKIAIQ